MRFARGGFVRRAAFNLDGVSSARHRIGFAVAVRVQDKRIAVEKIAFVRILHRIFSAVGQFRFLLRAQRGSGCGGKREQATE